MSKKINTLQLKIINKIKLKKKYGIINLTINPIHKYFPLRQKIKYQKSLQKRKSLTIILLFLTKFSHKVQIYLLETNSNILQ